MIHRNSVIDALRGLSIILVVGIHYFDLFNFIYPDTYSSGGALNRLFGHGYYGVTIFFVISGYLITSSNAKAHPDGTFSVKAGRFYIKRATRIVPLLLVIVLTSAAIIASVGVIAWKPYVYVYQVGKAGYGPGFWAAIAFFSFNWLEILWVPYNDGWFGLQWNVLWSLAVEEQFYIVFPLMIAATKTRENVSYLGAFLIAAALTLRAILVLKGASPAVVYDNSICCFDALIVGVLIALSKPPGRKVSTILLGAGSVLFAVCYLLPYYALAGTPVLGMAAAAGLIIQGSRAVRAARPPRILTPLCELGGLSYGAYLLHAPALLIVFTGMQLVGKSAWLGFIACLALTFVMARLSFLLFERPVETKLRALLIGSGPAQRRASAAGTVDA